MGFARGLTGMGFESTLPCFTGTELSYIDLTLQSPPKTALTQQVPSCPFEVSHPRHLRQPLS